MNKRILFVLVFLHSVAFAQTRKYSNEFLQLGVGSRAFGMAGSVISSTDDVTSGYWNPAGLMKMRTKSQASFMHSEYFAGIAKYDYGSLATFVADNTAVVGFSIIRFGVDDIPDTSELIDADGNINYNRVTSFSAADYAFIFSYARKPKGKSGKSKDKTNNQNGKTNDEKSNPSDPNGLSYGANVKIIHRKVGEYGKSWGFGIDVGAQYKLNNFTFSGVGRDITTTFNAWSYNSDKFSSVYSTTQNDIPQNSNEITLPRVILGAAYYSKLNENFGLTTEANFNFTTDGRRNVLISADPVSMDPTLGLEADFKKTVYLRGGIGNIQKVSDFEGKKTFEVQPNMGVGIRIKNFSLDYALTNIGNSSDALYSNVFSIRLDFEKK